MAESILSGVNKALANAIPLVLRKNQMDWEQAKFEEAQKQEQAKLMQDAEDAKTKFKINLYNEAVKSDSPEAKAFVNRIAPQIEKTLGLELPSKTVMPATTGGMMTGPVSLPEVKEYLTFPKAGKEGAFNIDKKIWDAVGGDLNAFAAVKKRMKESGGKPQEINTLEELAVTLLQGGNMQGANKILSIIKDLRTSAQKESTGTTPGERKRKQLEDDIQQTLGQLGSVESGQNIMTESLGSQRGEVATRKRKRLKQMLSGYDKAYGNGSAKERFGVESSDFDQAKSQYQSADDVKSAYKAGTITKEEAAKILRESFGYK